MRYCCFFACLTLLLNNPQPSAAQAQAPIWTVPLRLTNNGSESVLLNFGLAAEATDGLDDPLDEKELPPLPPQTILDIRWQINRTNGTRLDLRPAGSTEVIWTVQIQAGSGGFPITFLWTQATLPAFGTFRLQDAITEGELINVDMRQASSLTVENQALTLIRIAYTGPTIVSTTINASLTAQQPETFSLDQNFPNPFNASTLIRFSLVTPLAAELSVFSASGQKIRTLWRAPQANGSYTLEWDGRNDAGYAMASGVYLYHLQTPARTGSRKVLLLR